jgi:hypothetical protein
MGAADSEDNKMVMGKYSFRKWIPAFASLCLVFAVSDSCTYDYFVDETNFRLYVPQIESGEISSLYVSFHEVNGDHAYTRRVYAPFDGITNGILKFHILSGQYTITTFADYNENGITDGAHISESYKGATSTEGLDGVYTPASTRADDADGNHPRALFLRDLTIYPLGHPDGQQAVTADIDEEHRFKGFINYRFVELPANVITRIVTTIKGPATRFGFDGAFERFAPTDIYRHEVNTAQTRQDNGDIVFTSHVYPSTGEVHHDATADAISRAHGGEEIELQIEFYNGENLSGRITLTSADIAGLDADKKPVDADGNPVTDLVLRPRQTLSFLFRGFTLIGIKLEPWGPIKQGGFDNL